MSTDQVGRTYNIPDTDMYEAARTMRESFILDKPGFITFDADFADPYAADWLTLIETAEALPQDEVLDDELTELTADVENEMKNCREKFQDSKYFIEKAFPDNKKRWNTFGFDDYDNARIRQGVLILFMNNFHTQAVKYKIDLIAAGYSQAKIDEIATRHTALLQANQDQESFKKEIAEQTQARHNANNEVWAEMVKTGSAGKRIFKNNFAKYQRYLLPLSAESPQVLSISGTVTDSANGNPLEGVLVKIASLGIDTTTDANGKYEFGGLPDDTYAIEFSLANYVTKTVNASVAGGVGVVVNVQLTHV